MNLLYVGVSDFQKKDHIIVIEHEGAFYEGTITFDQRFAIGYNLKEVSVHNDIYIVENTLGLAEDLADTFLRTPLLVGGEQNCYGAEFFQGALALTGQQRVDILDQIDLKQMIKIPDPENYGHWKFAKMKFSDDDTLYETFRIKHGLSQWVGLIKLISIDAKNHETQVSEAEY